MTSMKCPFCEDGQMVEQPYDTFVRSGRRNIQIEGLQHFLCDRCDQSLTNRRQTAHNRSVMQAAQDRDVITSVDAAFLQALRARHDLTQRAASRLFGAGESSFAKWESAQSAVSTPTALLLRCAAEVPGVIEHIAALRGEALPPTVEEAPPAVVHLA
ncbi:type II TA system antitoxin MqsA family protein [Roseateles amylovorans]|uniref:Type II toxin-antitoxin system MqsA family antitoxin n=1 Tax=Roseateles amylovorans TaxID=2978473 RepID=A0ABY6B1Z3_9BURK|nr:type II TA system antitoxin MqsA family protein [Roseateles amylovorans]UXH77538.1 type II toxin-antitoxin system MqsA family antitoxin [Roseateles amylovorans]